MKRLLLILLALALVLPGAMATSMNFQNPTDYWRTGYFGAGNGADPNKNVTIWSETTNGGNNQMKISLYADGVSGYKFAGRMLPSAYSTTYSAATLNSFQAYSAVYPAVVLLSNDKSVMYTYAPNSGASSGRWEVRVVGGVATIYRNGVSYASSGALGANPSYIAFGMGSVTGYNPSGSWGYAYWDDYVYGDSEEKLVLGLPESDNDAFIILKDITNSANDGLYNTTSRTQTDANYMTGTWSRGNSSIGVPLENQTITLINYNTNAVYWTGYTGSGYYGTFSIPIKTNVIDAGAPDGMYVLTSPGTLSISNAITKRSNGAEVSFNKDEYSRGDTATTIYYVASGGYWDTSLYSYKLSIVSALWEFKQNSTLTSSSGYTTYSWSDDDDDGLYYALLIATDGAGREYILGSDYAELVEYFGVEGIVMAHNTTPIEGAYINITQGTNIEVDASGFDGNYSVSPAFSTGAPLTINATAPGYRQYAYSFSPQIAKTLNINITLVPLLPMNPTEGLGIGGVVRDVTYGRPMSGVLVDGINQSDGYHYNFTTNLAGWYLCAPSTSCHPVYGRTYFEHGSKLGYDNSSEYPVLVTGALA